MPIALWLLAPSAAIPGPPGEPLYGYRLGAALLVWFALGVLPWLLRPRPTLLERWVAVAAGVFAAAGFLSPMSWMERLFVWGTVAVLALIVIQQQRRPVLQYLFFCRFPLSIGALLVSLPAIGLWVAPDFFRNLFVMNALGVFLVSLLSVLASWVVMLTAGLVGELAPARFGIEPWNHPRWIEPLFGHHLWCTAATGLLALPTLAAAIFLAEARWWVALSMAGLGVLTAGAFFYVSLWISHRLLPHGAKPWGLLPGCHHDRFARAREIPAPRSAQIRQTAVSWLSRQSPAIYEGYLRESTLHPGHTLCLGLLLTNLVLYFAGFWLLRPAWLMPEELAAPPLAYVLFLLILLGWFLPFVSFFFDRFRVPVLLLIGVVPFLLYFTNDIDHYYEVSELAAEEQPAGPVSKAAVEQEIKEEQWEELKGLLDNRRDRWKGRHRGREPILVAVSASGGGITASYWTATVLKGLQSTFGEPFSESIYLISSVSGGSLGTMYFVNQFEEGSVPTEKELEKAVENAGTSCLSATAWGLTYPDFWRAFSVHNPWLPFLDRGWAMEQTWKKTLAGEKPVPTLSAWLRGTREGWRPAVLFNATISETGQRFVLSPLPLNPLPDGAMPDSAEYGDALDGQTLRSLFRNKDVPVTTAVRLSATFPFVSPIARAYIDREEGHSYHVADGGYYDNFGVVSLVEWLYRGLRLDQARQKRDLAAGREHVRHIRKILIVQITVADGREEKPQPKTRAGWAYGVAGPMLTLLKVRDSAQQARNNLDLTLLQDLARLNGFEIENVQFPLTVDAPTSWHLTQEEKKKIYQEWSAAREGSKVRAGLDKIGCFLEEAQGWEPADCQEKPAVLGL